MSTNETPSLLTLPASLKRQLLSFRSRVWTTKVVEAVGLACLAVLVALLSVFIVDRFVDTSPLVRAVILIAMTVTMLVIPIAIYRWVYRNRRLDQLARLLRQREPSIGDQLLGVIELAESDTEQSRSRALCAAAIEQVAGAAQKRNLNDAAPRHWLPVVGSLVGAALLAMLGLLIWSPPAVSNAWSRLLSPFNGPERYTFTAVEPMPESMIVPHGESVRWTVALDPESRWQPEQATLTVPGYPEQVVSLVKPENATEAVARTSGSSGRYEFQLPASTAPSEMMVRIGDFYQSVQLDPQFRPELVAANAMVQLPEYLQIKETMERDVRSGTLSVVQGSKAKVTATASRDLEAAAINEEQVAVINASFSSADVSIDGEAGQLALTWRDRDGLEGKQPFELSLKSAPDEAPSVVTQELPRQAVLLDSEQLNFQAMSADDFGIKRVGLEWRGLDDRMQTPAEGEKVLAMGGPEQSSLQLPATFSAKSFGIEPQPIELRLWVEDYLPGRNRVYSSPHIFYVLTPEQHAIWMTNEMSKWHRAALDVRDREMGLHERNKQIREMSPEELADDAMRDEIRKQARGEASNGRQLASLSRQGKELLRQAARNPELGVGHLEKWAEMLQILEDISANRMPSVAELLDKASAANKIARKDSKSGPQAGKNRATAGAPGGEDKPEEEKKGEKPAVPSLVDQESSQQPADPAGEEPNKKKKESNPRLTLPVTTIAGPPKKPDPAAEKEEDKPEEPMDEAIKEQKDLLAEFEKVADELNTLLANLEGSTLVKRLKAMSREQNQIAERISERIDAVFGDRSPDEKTDRELLAKLSEVELGTTKSVSYIMDDMQSYFERRRMNQFKAVLDEMRESEVLTALTTLSEDIPKEQGMSIAQAEFWSDSFDRWADDLVDPACSGQCPGCKGADSLPPSVILEVLQILEGEVNLREETRVTEQAREAMEKDDHKSEAIRLSETQDGLRDRTDQVIERIEQLPEGAAKFAKEIDLLTAVSRVMVEAREILVSAETGSAAIAAETEAIELLLRCKRINPKGGGGGGSSPGGGGQGDTQDAALALLGTGVNEKEQRRATDVTQATGETGRALPEEFRAGLDEYFNRLERQK
ncbi:hypothetical protein [Stieleria varia]|uniref:Uncharacterized protein n=1 Tax=Stieleria varia TaxID=2528005 RepID=A0A5C6AL82_9BACT|nr:hypothetical protein [Stieleria varia]TWU00773.1 hypothetical protein Pla52n_41420 [Stieleria varia]